MTVQIIAIDTNREAYEIGVPFIKKAGVEHKIDFIESPALPVLDNLSGDPQNDGDFDFAFVEEICSHKMTSLEERIDATKWLLHPSSGSSSCCIFKVPQCFVEINKNSYQPRIVSFGPFHHGNEQLEMMQQHKWRFLRDLLARTPPTGPKLNDYLKAVAEREEDIRGCYSITIGLCSHDLAEMMVLDGLFIVELFCKVGLLSPSDPEDPIFNLTWIFLMLSVKPNLRGSVTIIRRIADCLRDMLRLENQVPFYVLQMLFEKSKSSREDSDHTLSKLALEFFNYAINIPEEVLQQNSSVEAKHLLDLLRLSFVLTPLGNSKKLSSFRRIKNGTKKAVNKLLAGMKYKRKSEDASYPVEFIKSAKKFYLAGIKFKKREAMSFFDIRFNKGVLEIPHISLDDLHTDIFLNFVAFEACYIHCSKHITTYAAFMTCLIRTPADATFLCDNNIIENYLGTDEQVADFFRNQGKDVPFDIDESYPHELFKDVNEYQRNVWHVEWAGFKFKYFDIPWSFLSALAAVILLLFTAVQSYFAVYSYVHPPR